MKKKKVYSLFFLVVYTKTVKQKKYLFYAIWTAKDSRRIERPEDYGSTKRNKINKICSPNNFRFWMIIIKFTDKPKFRATL